ncbi:MAG: efflux transporter outer membrane subunit [Rhodovibrionaceae bacterium]
MSWRRFPRRLALAAVLPLAACTAVGPEYTAPEPSLPAAYSAPVPALFQASTQGALPERWWETFRDPILNTLVERGIAANLDLRIAASRVREARASVRAVTGASGPQFDLSSEAGVETTRRSGSTSGSSSGSGSGGGTTTETEGTASAGLGGVWEIDLFGGNFRSRQAAWARARQQEALEREALRLTAAEIARTYIELRAAQRRLALAETSLDLLRQTFDLVDRRVDTGLAPGLDRSRAQAAVSAFAAEIGPLRAQIGRFGNALAVLLDENPGALDPLLAEPRPLPLVERGAPLGVPRNLLRRRPDIQAAELAIVAATADVGVETADLYPRLTLPGSITLGISNIGAEGPLVTSIVAALSALVNLPIYDGGTRQAEITQAEERVIQAGLSYRQTLLDALNGVESALLDYAGSRDRMTALAEAVESNRQAFEQSQALYQGGFATFIDVLDSQRSYNVQLQALALAQRDVALQAINLYSALGTTLEPPERAGQADS